ncbi:hypothetical protein F5B20DRAFT_495445 [Whalleya microplaca]|nr:hypothetical protein F5B20DRAFT_495445 [Whalleya microplaca]
MVFRDSQLFPDSLWSNETNSVVLRRVSEPFSPPFSTTTTRTPVSEPGDPGSASRFSLSSDDPPSSESSNGVLPQLGRSLRRARLSPIPRSYTSFGRHSRRRVSSRTSAGLQAIDEMDWPIPPRTKPTLQQSAHAPNGPEVPDNDMPRARAFLFVVVICMAQLSARESCQSAVGCTLLPMFNNRRRGRYRSDPRHYTHNRVALWYQQYERPDLGTGGILSGSRDLHPDRGAPG